MPDPTQLSKSQLALLRKIDRRIKDGNLLFVFELPMGSQERLDLIALWAADVSLVDFEGSVDVVLTAAGVAVVIDHTCPMCKEGKDPLEDTCDRCEWEANRDPNSVHQSYEDKLEFEAKEKP